MTIRKGEEWGHGVPRPDRMPIAVSDRDLAEHVAAGFDGPVGVSGGDLFRAVGAPGQRDPVMRLPIDLLRVVADDTHHTAVAHVIARRSWWRGSVVAVMNVDHLGEWNVAPRAHPNDGRFDVVEVDPAMTLRQRLQARRRLAQGTHIPHPSIAARTSVDVSWQFDREQHLWIDGVQVGSVRQLSVTIESDGFAIHV